MAGNTFANRRSLSVKLNAIGQKTRKEVGRAVRRGALLIENTAVDKIISPPKTGIVYASKHRKGATHQASAPGEAPAADSGLLHQSITSVMTHEGPDRYISETGANTPYATRLEFGGSHVAVADRGPVRVHIAPRPFMGPSFDENKDAVERSIHAAIVRAARSGGKP